MASRKEIIEDKYNVLQRKINSKMNMNLFPPLEIMSVIDIISNGGNKSIFIFKFIFLCNTLYLSSMITFLLAIFFYIILY